MKNIKKIIVAVLMLITLLAPVVTFADIIVAPPDRLPPENGDTTVTPPDRLPPEDGDTILPPIDTLPGDDGAPNPEPTPIIKPPIKDNTGGLVQCGRKTIYLNEKNEEVPPGTPGAVKIADPKDACDFDDVMYLINNIINWILLGLALPIAGIMFAYAGFTLITSGGSSSAKTKAKEIFFNAAVGLVLAFTAYLIIVFVLKALGYDGSWIFSMF